MYTLNQLLIIDRFWKYIPPIDNDKDWTKDIPHLEDVFRIAEEKLWDDYEIRISNKSIYFFSRSKWAFEYPYKRWTPLLEQPESVLIELLKLFK